MNLDDYFPKMPKKPKNGAEKESHASKASAKLADGTASLASPAPSDHELAPRRPSGAAETRGGIDPVIMVVLDEMMVRITREVTNAVNERLEMALAHNANSQQPNNAA